MNDGALCPTTVYGLCGFAGSGKNTAASLLLKHTHGHAYSFAGPLKDGVAAIFGWTREMLEGDTWKSRAWRDQSDPDWSHAFGRSVTPRMILQEVGTEVFRKYLPNIWVEAAARRMQTNATAIFTDTRFGNEMSWINNQGGILIWVYRPKMPHLSTATGALVRTLVDQHKNLMDERNVRQLQRTCQADKAHASETAFLFDGPVRPHVVMKNTSTADELSLMMRHIHMLHTTTGMVDFPWGTRTLYLSMLDDQYWWEWTNTQGHDSYRAYTTENICVARGDNDGR